MGAADTFRAAAVDQLTIWSERAGVPIVSQGMGADPASVAYETLTYARDHQADVAIIDTAGRLHIDEALMKELVTIKSLVKPHEILLVVDSMTGQDAVNVAQTFNSSVGIDGVVLTKLDGDARGGAALSIKAVTGKPIKFAGVSEKLDGLEPFHPDRMANRILGMGDVLSLIEKAEATLDAEKAKEMAEKLAKSQFTLEDFLEQLQQVKKMGPLDNLLGLLPTMGGAKKLQGLEPDPSHLKRIEAIIYSMTKEERRNPTIIGGSRRKRIALGSGTKVQDVNRLLKQFEQTRQMMKQFTGMEKGTGKKKRKPFKIF